MEKYYIKSDKNVKTWAGEICHYQDDGTRIGCRMCTICENFIEDGTDQNGAWIKCKEIETARGLL